MRQLDKMTIKLDKMAEIKKKKKKKSKLVVSSVKRVENLSYQGSPIKREVKRNEITQSCPTLCNPMDSNLHQAPPSTKREANY